MSQHFNITNQLDPEENYLLGLLPQRNDKTLFYSDSSCRSNLSKFNLSSENRRILRKTENFSFKKVSIKDFDYNPKLQKKLSSWTKEMEWNFPVSSIKNIFTDHIFNFVYIWKYENGQEIGYSLCFETDKICHIAYVFYEPGLSHGNLPIRMVLQSIIDSHEKGLQFCYLGRFSNTTGFYKRNMPGFEYFDNEAWIEYNKPGLIS